MLRVQIIEQFQKIMDAFIISVLASFIRLMFNRDITFLQTMANFFGGVALGVLVGFLIRDAKWANGWNEIIIAAAALAGKEIVKKLIIIIPTFIKNIPDYIRLLINKKMDHKNE